MAGPAMRAKGPDTLTILLFGVVGAVLLACGGLYVHLVIKILSIDDNHPDAFLMVREALLEGVRMFVVFVVVFPLIAYLVRKVLRRRRHHPK